MPDSNGNGNLSPGAQIRRLREERGLRPVDIQRISETVKLRKNCADFGISHGTLNDLENENSVPNVRKMFSLAVCFQVPLEYILTLYDASPGEISAFCQNPAVEESHEPARIETIDESFIVQFDTAFDVRRTSPLLGNDSALRSLPLAIRSQLDPTRYSYAWVGTEDGDMADLIPGGSLIEIDRRESTLKTVKWTSLRSRPIYFSWTKDGYRCSWCEENERELVLLPHPASGAQARRYKKPREMTLIGQVVHAWVPFGTANQSPSLEPSSSV
jgi:transcriptional regulator with XRE-family HTH domain